MKIKAEHMRSLPEFFKRIPDPRRGQSKRHFLPTVLAIAAGGVLCGMRSYNGIWDWAYWKFARYIVEERNAHYHFTVKENEADEERILKVNRGHWTIENSCHYILDRNYDEDRSRIRTGYGPENMTRLRRFAIGIVKSKKQARKSVAQKMRQLSFNVRAVFDYLKMTKNSQTTPSYA